MVSNENVATFIKELVLDRARLAALDYQPGDYLQFDIPAYDEISFDEIAVNAPFAEIWKARRFGFRAENRLPIRRDYSMATTRASIGNCDSTSASARRRPAGIAPPGPARPNPPPQTG